MSGGLFGDVSIKAVVRKVLVLSTYHDSCRVANKMHAYKFE